MTERIWLDVPYGEKDRAKAAGARWDPTARRWYAPRPGMEALRPWEALPEVPDPLPGEDRTFGSGLFVDLVPSSCWFTNVRSCVAERDWERLRRMLLRRAGYRCEICGRGEDRASRRRLEAHERWSYDETRSVQALRRLVCLCGDCHRTTHFGLAQVRGQAEAAFEHLRAVTGMSREQAEAHVDEAFALWRRRSARAWTLDLSLLTEAGITLAEPPPAHRRGAVAAAELARERESRA
ncbi:DUF5710 domain-containing protein [Actinopolyspora mortivallis]|uniref:DNA primase n=1 Tax=Actinopolyspora mortivallis TaxID=33906 RepID=A0A2T0GTC7_ACTMO|nr:DUF5710 domain-containing protein [Actinopolyspora mortivallis]PRW62359.1 DNA primase [Actinopolyspora mortivallis]